MQEYSVNIKIDKLVDGDVLRASFGGHLTTVVARDGRTLVIKHVMLDEGLITGEVTAQSLAQSIYDAHDYDALQISQDLEAQVTVKYNEMVADVMAGMLATFGTTSENSANAYSETWKLMMATPADWSGAGLTARFALGGLAVDAALDTDQKVLDYATACSAAVKAYGIVRMQRIEQFKSEKLAILS